ADFPEMNALYDDEAETVERHAGVHIGVATQTPSGMMVPVAQIGSTSGRACGGASDRADSPEMNALYDDEAETVERHAGVHIGVATQTPSGLMVPVAQIGRASCRE